MTALRATKLKCLGCCCGSSNEVCLRHCQDSPLHSFRLRHNPNYQKEELSKAKRATIPAWEKLERLVMEVQENGET